MDPIELDGVDDFTQAEFSKLAPWQKRLAKVLVEHLGWVPGTDFHFASAGGEWRIVNPHYPANGRDAENAWDVLTAHTDPAGDPMALDPVPDGEGFAIILVEV